MKYGRIMLKYSMTYVKLLELMSKVKIQEQKLYANSYKDGLFKKVGVNETTYRPSQELVITDTDLFTRCTPAMWYLVGIICSQMKLYNVLWYCEDSVKKSSTNRVAIKGLIELGVLIPTETTNIYIVDPFHIRRGDYLFAIFTTLSMVSKHTKIQKEHIINKMAIREYNANSDNGKPIILLDEGIGE